MMGGGKVVGVVGERRERTSNANPAGHDDRKQRRKRRLSKRGRGTRRGNWQRSALGIQVQGEGGKVPTLITSRKRPCCAEHNTHTPARALCALVDSSTQATFRYLTLLR